MSEPLWQPNPGRVAGTQLFAFQGQVGCADYAALHKWSIDHPERFWDAVWDCCGIVGAKGSEVVQDGSKFFDCRWFPDARLNYAENLLARTDQATAFVSIREDGLRTEISYAELRMQTARLATWMADHGITTGDRVAAWLPNCVETVVVMLAATSLGATFSSCSPDFGVSGALDRFGQIEPKLLVACDGYYYAGKHIDTRRKMQEVADSVPGIARVLWVDYAGSDIEGDRLTDVLKTSTTPELTFNRLPFDHPLYILYSSGTTGKPKCIVHGAGGTLLQHAKEHRLHTDLRAEDTLFFFTTAGWMMWNWLVSALATGCRIVLYDGSPFHPQASRLFDLAQDERVSVFGISAKFLQASENAGLSPRTTHHLDSVRCILSTGSTLPHEGFQYVYRDVKSDVQLSSMSGGTDIISCFVLGNPTLPVYEGELQSNGLGMAVEVWNDEGEPVVEERGELVCTQPFPSAPIGFWRDENDVRYRTAYFERFDGVWAHGDFAEVTRHAGMIIHGRSDAVLNPGGVRIGTAEIYRQVERFEQILEAVCVGQNWDNDVRVILFVVLREEATLSEELISQIKAGIRNSASPRHVPAKVIAVSDIPRTMSGKIAELAVRDVIHGRTVANTAALANPASLAAFRDLEELAH